LDISILHVDQQERTPPAREGSKPAKQQQDQQNDDDQAQASATIIAGAIEWTAAYSAKATKQGYDKNNQDDRSNRHSGLPAFGVNDLHILTACLDLAQARMTLAAETQGAGAGIGTVLLTGFR
jgi:hypothetical protein